MSSPFVESTSRWLRWKQRLLSAATVIILSVIIWCNLPDSFRENVFRIADSKLSPEGAYRVRYAEWLVRYSAYLGGFDSKWQMFGLQSSFNCRYIITAEYGDDENIVQQTLPLPRQSDRTTFQRKFVDFKEAKFLLNIYNDRLARETYARYLARQYPEYQGLPVRSVSYTLVVQYILPPIVAVQQQQLLERDVQSDVIDTFDVTSERSHVTGTVVGLF